MCRKWWRYEEAPNKYEMGATFAEVLSESATANAWVHFVGSGRWGIKAVVATYPLDLVRTRLAAHL